MSFVGADVFGGSGKDYASMAEEQEAARQQKIKTGTESINNAFAGFTPDFYKKRQQAYQDFAMPQLSDQFNQTKNQIGYNLANRGLLGSGAGERQWTELGKTMTNAKQGIVDSGITQAQQLQSQVEATKNQQLATLYQSADPSEAAAGATSAAAGFVTPSVFPAIANQFNGLLNQYYTSQLINAYKPMALGSPGGGQQQQQSPWPTSISTGGR